MHAFGLAFTIFLASIIGCAFYAGRMYERIEWNKLIKDGILPTPKRRTP